MKKGKNKDLTAGTNHKQQTVANMLNQAQANFCSMENTNSHT